MPARGNGTTSERLEELAYQQGRRDADVDARLLSHERRLTKGDDALDEMRESIEGIDKKVDRLIAAQDARDAVEEDREERSTQTAQQLFSRRTLQVAFVTVVVMLLGVMVSVFALLVTVH